MVTPPPAVTPHQPVQSAENPKPPVVTPPAPQQPAVEPENPVAEDEPPVEEEPGEPEFGFLFPAFLDRSSDSDKIDIFNKDPDHVQTALMKKILGLSVFIKGRALKNCLTPN